MADVAPPLINTPPSHRSANVPLAGGLIGGGPPAGGPLGGIPPGFIPPPPPSIFSLTLASGKAHKPLNMETSAARKVHSKVILPFPTVFDGEEMNLLIFVLQPSEHISTSGWVQTTVSIFKIPINLRKVPDLINQRLRSAELETDRCSSRL